MSGPASALRSVAIVSLVLAGLSAIIVVGDELGGHRQRMWIMNVVWPVTALWAGPLGLIAYFTLGRATARRAGPGEEAPGAPPPNATKPFWASVCIAASHCGCGCTLGDLIVEWGVLAVPVALFGSRIAGTWVADYVVAFAFGIAFQYFSIAPMRHLSPKAGLAAALKADTLSLSAWQLGMYGWMALVLFVFFAPGAVPKTGPVFWFMMQIAMLAGFLTSYPVNWRLLRRGIKERM